MFQLHVSIYALITSISTKEIILFHNYKFVSRVGFTNAFTSILRRIIISLASWQLSIYTSLNSHLIGQSEAQLQANTQFKEYLMGWFKSYCRTFTSNSY